MRIAYFTPNTFAHVNAGALRNIAVSHALTHGGMHVDLISTDPSGLAPHSELAVLCSDHQVRLLGGGLPGPRSRPRSVAMRALAGGISQLGYLLDALAPDLLLLYGSDPIAFGRLRAQGRQRAIPLMVDLTEWHDRDNWPGGRFGPHALSHDVVMTRLMPRADAALAISTRMAALASRLGQPALVVPPLTLVAPTGYGERMPAADRRKRLVSVGTDLRATGKDGPGLRLTLRALAELDPQAERFVVDIVGPSTSAVAALIPDLDLRHAHCLGRRSWRETQAIVESADLSLALRETTDRRVNYGFPSKVPESLALGTPVLATRYSDLADHIVDGHNGVLIDELDTTSFRHALEALPRLDSPGVIAHEAGLRYHPDSWTDRLVGFLSGVVSRGGLTA